ncbi:MAG: hypothetical protein H6981_01510 [Gammaproteobacteria bacterium]|nr:hypothetical protein [Gammaproteobacteria bacterium]MCP5135464.1 hypothetical protein [Gammaproteobacteria bacterium]
MKVITSLNWVVGSLLLLLAVSWPLIDKVLTNSEHAVIETTVQNLVTAQQTHHSIREDYVVFAANERDMQTGFGKLDVAVPASVNFIYESYRAEDGAVVVLGRASPAAIVRERMPPLAYSVRIGPDGHAEEGEWQE